MTRNWGMFTECAIEDGLNSNAGACGLTGGRHLSSMQRQMVRLKK